MDCKFVVGQNVVCAHNVCVLCGKKTRGNLEIGRIYEISAIDHIDVGYFSGVFVSVVGADNPCAMLPNYFYHMCFRPTKETNIDVFKEALAPKPRAPMKREKEKA